MHVAEGRRQKSTPELRAVNPSALGWVALPNLMEASRTLYEEIVKAREVRAGKEKVSPWARTKASARLRAAQPW